jgi:hypothetical protein
VGVEWNEVGAVALKMGAAHLVMGALSAEARPRCIGGWVGASALAADMGASWGAGCCRALLWSGFQGFRVRVLGFH